MSCVNYANNVALYIDLLAAAEHNAMVGQMDKYDSLVEEMDELWQELTSQEKTLVEEKLGWFPS